MSIETVSREGLQGTRPDVPRTVMAYIGLLVLVALIQLYDVMSPPNIIFGDLEPPAPPFWFKVQIFVVNGFGSGIFIALIGYGLWRASRFVWVLAIIYSVQEALAGVLNMVTSDAGWSDVVALTPAGFHYGFLRIAVGVIGLALLLAPATRDWMRRDLPR